jgi:hypothetical protein
MHRHTATDTHGDQIQRAGPGGGEARGGVAGDSGEGVSGIKHAGAIGFIVVTIICIIVDISMLRHR